MPATTIEQIRQQYPQYGDMSDAELARRLHDKHYPDMSQAEFNRRVGFTDALRTDESGQTVFDVDAARAGIDRATPSPDVGGAPEPEYVGDPMDWITTSALKGGSKLVRGLASLIPDLAGYDEAGQSVRQAIPKVTGGQTGTETAGTVLQYGIPAGVGYRAASGIARAASAGRLPQYIAGLTGAAAGDTAATIPEETATVGDLVGGPTALEEDDTSRARRLKTGAETIPLGPIADVAAGGGRGLIEAFTGNRMRSMLGENLRRGVRETGEEPEEVARRLEEAAGRAEGPEQAGYRPTTGTASDNQALLAAERGVSSQPNLVQRFEANREALTEAALDAVRTSGDPEAARRFFLEQYQGPTKAAEAALDEVQLRLDEAQSELGLSASRARETGTQADVARASEGVDETTRNELVALTAQKNRLFDQIDPAGTKGINQKGFREAVDEATQPTSRGDLNQIPGDIRDRITLMSEEGGVTFAELNDLRPRVSAAIRQAREAGEGGVVQRLEGLRRFMNDQAERLAAKNDPKAQEALRFYKDEFVPRFGSGAGARFRKAVRGDKAEPSQTGRMFLLGPKEGSTQLRTILDNADNPQEGLRAAEDFLSAQLGRRLATVSDKSAGQTAQRFINDYSAVLQQFPELRQRLQTTQRELSRKAKRVSGLTESVRRQKSNVKLTEKEQNQSAARYFLNAEPDKAVERAFGSGRPAAAMRELRQQAKESPAAIKGLRSATKDYMKRVLTNPSAGEDVAATVNRVNKAFNNDRLLTALKQVYTPKEIDRLRKVQNRLNEMSRIDQRVTTNSITNQLSQDSERARIILSSLYGIVQGRGIFAIGNWIGNQVRGQTLKEAAGRVVQDATLDPELAAKLLRQDSKEARRELRTYLTNNYPEMFGSQDQGEDGEGDQAPQAGAQ